MVKQDHCAMKVTTDACLFGAWAADHVARLLSPEIISGTPTPGMLDIGAGTGLLSLMVAQLAGNLHIDAMEIDEEAAGQATENIAGSPWANRISLLNADAKAYPFNRQYDFIISNPPFYENDLKGNNPRKNQAHHNEGLLLSDLLLLIKNLLRPDGRFYILLPYKRQEEIRKMIVEKELGISRLILVRQSVNHGYFRTLLEGHLTNPEKPGLLFDEITIKDRDDQYSPAFLNLLKDYYLHL